MRRTALIAILLLLASLAAVGQIDAPADRGIRVLLLTGEGNHSWRETSVDLAETLSRVEGITCDIETRPDQLREPDFLGYDCLLSEYGGDSLGEEAQRAILGFVEAGGGWVALHSALYACRSWEAYASLVGATWGPKSGYGFVHSFPVDVMDPTHPITLGMTAFQQSPDELFHGLTLMPGAKALLTAESDPLQGGTGAAEPMCWVLERGAGRIVGLTLGHDLRSHGIALNTLLARSVEWAATGRVVAKAPVVWPRAGMPMAQLEGFITSWYVTGPWPSPASAGFDQTFPPEGGVDLKDAYAVKIGDRPTEIAWKWVKGAETDGSVDLDGALGHFDSVAIFAYAEVTVAQDQDVRLKVGSDDGVVVWVNGDKVHANNASRGVVLDQDVINTRFVAGSNRLLFKVIQGGGQWGLVVRITDRQDAPLMFVLKVEAASKDPDPAPEGR